MATLQEIFGQFDPHGVYSGWSSARGLQAFEDYLGKGIPFTREMREFIQDTSPSVSDSDAWSNWVRMMQARDSDGPLISELGLKNDTGTKLGLAAALAAAGGYYGGLFDTAAAGGGGGMAGGGGAGGGMSGLASPMMPAAVPETAATLEGWGLTQTAPGVWEAFPGIKSTLGTLGTAAATGAASAAAAEAIRGQANYPGEPEGQDGTGTGGPWWAQPMSSGVGSALGSGFGGVVDSIMKNPALLGAGLGALAGGLGGAKPAGTTTVVQDVPEWTKPYATEILQGAQKTYQNAPDYSSLVRGGGDELSKTVSGAYLRPESNPYLRDTANLAMGDVRSQVNSNFSGNNFGSSTHQEWLGKKLTDAAMPFYFGNYNTERDRQFRASGAAPSFASSAYESSFGPQNAYKNLVSGWGQQTQSPYFNNPMANILGGALAGGAMGSFFK